MGGLNHEFGSSLHNYIEHVITILLQHPHTGWDDLLVVNIVTDSAFLIWVCQVL